MPENAFRALAQPGPWVVLGLMSGTSADGVDLSAVEVQPEGFGAGRPFRALLDHHHGNYPRELRQEILAAASNNSDPARLCILQRKVGEFHASTAREWAARTGLKPHFASLHGQTVQHRPAELATLQLADPYLLVEALGCPVVWDLRRRDLAVGGQGAPLVPRTELWLRGREEAWVALNIGGIANTCVWDRRELRAWDLGPGMSLLDLAAQRWLGLPFDPEGGHADGNVDEACLSRWLEHPHFHQPPPKSTGREVFGAAWLAMESPGLDRLALPDRLATLAAFTAAAIRKELDAWGLRLPAGTVILTSGGGTLHARLMGELAARLPDYRLESDQVFPPGAREAISWALLGAASALGIPGNLPEVTGASRAVPLGSWVFP
ncbi:MAG: anhydro-N-acetylmuramic acid kinase [Acidobacteria bacterium]|nr:anhydro-N-acetylmuramic acid kinase [Acidobacteriota bacterium]